MAYKTLNGFDVEHASSLLIYENLFPEIQHINGKGCTDKYTKTNDVESIHSIDVMRMLPYAPRFRQLGATNNGSWHNQKNEGGFGNAPQSVHYTIPVDLYYDEGVAIASTQLLSNPTDFKAVVMSQIIKAAGFSINIVTFAKQLLAFFKDSFSSTAKAEELAEAIFVYDKTKATNEDGSVVDAFIAANAKLTDGIPEIGAFQVPIDERQAFITSEMNRLMKRQYETNASDAAAKILANGFINPFTGSETTRINTATGLCGMYDGVGMFLVTPVTKKFVYVAMGLTAGTDDTLIATLEKIQGLVVYGAGTVRGIVGPTVDANPNIYFGGVYILPRLKMGVEVLSGKTIKAIANAAIATTDVDALTAKITFTPIDGKTVTGNNVFGAGVFNDGSKN